MRHLFRAVSRQIATAMILSNPHRGKPCFVPFNRGDRRFASPDIHEQLILVAFGRQPLRFDWHEIRSLSRYSPPKPKPKWDAKGLPKMKRFRGMRVIPDEQFEMFTS